MALNATCSGMEKRSLFLCMWNRIFIFVGIVIFSPYVYTFHSGACSEVVFQIR